MKKRLILILILFAILSCNKTSKNENITDETKIDSVLLKNQDSESKAELETKSENWYDDIAENYIKNSDNELIKISLKNKEKVEWLLDRTEKTDSTNFYIFNIGQDVTDENNTNPRFSSDGWIYIDSISKKVYEYDIPNDTIILWNKKHYR